MTWRNADGLKDIGCAYMYVKEKKDIDRESKKIEITCVSYSGAQGDL